MFNNNNNLLKITTLNNNKLLLLFKVVIRHFCVIQFYVIKLMQTKIIRHDIQ